MSDTPRLSDLRQGISTRLAQRHGGEAFIQDREALFPSSGTVQLLLAGFVLLGAATSREPARS